MRKVGRREPSYSFHYVGQNQHWNYITECLQNYVIFVHRLGCHSHLMIQQQLLTFSVIADSSLRPKSQLQSAISAIACLYDACDTENLVCDSDLKHLVTV